MPQQLPMWEADGMWGQCKMDGTCAILHVSRETNSYHVDSRHEEPMRRWSPTADHKAALLDRLPTSGAYILVGELMTGRIAADHPHAGHLKPVPIYFHDVLVADNESLVGTTYGHRYTLLEGILDYSSQRHLATDTHYTLDERTWLARNFADNLQAYYAHLLRMRRMFPEYEGLVLKKPKARLKAPVKADANTSWQLKCRFPSDSASF